MVKERKEKMLDFLMKKNFFHFFIDGQKETLSLTTDDEKVI